MKNELEGVKVGDKLKTTRQWSDQYEEYIVERVTSTQAVCNRDAKFKIDSGLMVGTGSYNRKVYASFLTDDDIKRAEMARRIKSVRCAIENIHITAENVEAAEAFIVAASANKEQNK